MSQVQTQAQAQAQALERVMVDIEKKFGKGTIMKMNGEVQKVPVISTGSIKLDKALGIGGIPKGRITEIYGPESSGKTTLTLHAIAEAQKAGETCAFIDAEHALDPIYAQALGINLDSLIVSQPDDGESALEVVDMLIRSGAVGLIVVDSVSALTPRAEINGEMGDSHMGLQARMMSQALRKITGAISKSNTAVIFINQLRMKIGVMFGNPETTTGGNALKFYASVRLDIRSKGPIKGSDSEAFGNDVKIKVAKNKLSPPFKVIDTVILYGKGFDIMDEVIDFAVDYEIVKKSGSWYSYNDRKIGQGKENTKTFFAQNKDVYDEIFKRVNEAVIPSLTMDYSGVEELQ